jgi:hypothetical protein
MFIAQLYTFDLTLDIGTCDGKLLPIGPEGAGNISPEKFVPFGGVVVAAISPYAGPHNRQSRANRSLVLARALKLGLAPAAARSE